MNTKQKVLGMALLAMTGFVIAACAQATPDQPAGEQPQVNAGIRTIFVGPLLVDCEGEGPQQCMLVKENPEDDYQLFYDQITGFDYEEGFEYELEVEVEQVENPPAGGSSLQYTLVRILNKQAVPVATGGQIKTVYVGPELVDCTGVGPQKCMQVKENPEDEYSLFYDQIEGFDFEEGYEYELVVQEEQVEDPPADASSIRWVLVSVENKRPGSEMGALQLEGPEWVLSAYINQDGEMVEAMAGSFASANFADGQVNGNASCNGYFGGYEVAGSSISIGPLAATEMFCGSPPGVMEQETAFLSAMGSAVEFKIESEQLVLLDPGGETILVFDVAEPLVLPGSLWDVLAYNNGRGGVVSVLQGTEITAYFGEDGQLSGSAGCNNYTAAYEIDGDQIKIGPAATTRMACGEPEGIMEQEAEYLAALENSGIYRIQDQERLILEDSQGSRMVDYKPARTFELTETIWYLESYNNGNDGVVSVLEGTEITAHFNDEELVSGNAGCNNYSGAYQVDGENITVELGPLTMMLCSEPEGVMEQETAYLQALDSAATFSIVGDQLVMQDADGQEVLKYKASDLVGFVWAWIEFLENNDTVTHPNMPANYTVEFLVDGGVAIQADCNRASGTYTLQGSQIDIEIGPVTLAACPEGSLSDEFLRLLGDAVIYFTQGEFLFLDIMMDAGTMKFFPIE